MKFENGDIVQFDTKSFGKGRGVVVGYHKCGQKNMWVIYNKKRNLPKSMQPDFMCFVVEENELIPTPF